ncbi:two-partner secretion domain-containing protein, partial [Pseudomonas jinjuensis]
MSRKKKQNPSVRSAITTVSVSLAAVAQTALAGPTGGVVAGGTATIDQSAALQTIINQATKKAVINWQEFDIPANELVKFVQAAGNDSVTLNRVLSNKFSNIQGALEANGNIFLINPNGIVFGANAKVDVAGLLASTLDVDPASFMSGDSLSFSQVQGKELASISNQGEIKVGDGGFVYLVAPKVDNSGMVIANIGRVTMAAGNRFNVDLQGSGLINFNVSADQLGSATGNAKVGVDNSGEIKAQNVLLQGNIAKDLMSSVVNNTGVIEATSLTINAAEIEQAGQIKAAAGTVNLTASDSIRTADGSSTRAGTLNLEVTNDGASIGAEGVALKVDADVLNAKAKNGHVLVTDVNGGVALGEITTGNKDNVNQRRAIIKSQNGSITSANPAKTNVTAWSTNLESDGAIGNAAQAVTTATDVLTASTQNGGIYVTDTDDQLILGKITARETLSVSGQPTALEAISDGSGQVTLSNGATGTKDVQIISQGSMFITGPVSATNFLGLGSFSGGLFNAADGTQLTGRNMTLIGDNVGQAERAFNIQSNKLDATARTGGVYITENNGLTVGSIQAGNGSDVVLKAAQGSLQVGSIVAQNGKVGLTADNGAILDNNGDALNVTAAELALNANTGIGASNNALETSISKLAAATRAAQSGIYVKNNLALQSIDAQTANGDAQIDFSGGQLSFNRNSGQLSLNAPLDLTFTNSAGALVLAGIDAGPSHSVKLTAAGNISQGSGRLTAGDVTLDASNNIGSADTALVTDTASLDLTSRNGTINVDNRSAQQTRVKASANSTNGAVSVKQAGALLVDSVSASKAVNLTAGGAIEGAADNSGFHVSAGSLNLDGAAIGSSTTALSTKVDAGSVSLTSRGGDINLSNVGNIALLNANASGKIAFRNSGDASIDRLQAGQSITFDITGAAKNGGSGVNFIATGLDVSAKSFGESGKAMQIQVQNLVIDTVNGGIYARQASGQLLGLMQATSGGSGSDIEISADGSIGLGTVNAGGNNVVLKAGGSIEDARSDKSKANVTARSLDMSAPGGIGMNGDLNLDVSFLSAAGGASGVKAANAGAIAVDNKTLTGKGSSEISIIAASITILDNNGGTITMDGGKLTMTATAGNIVFLNQSDTIYLPGGGSITLTAMSKSEMDGYSGVIIAGNLKTDGGDIKLQAQSNITIGMLDALGNAGTAGDVWVGSLHGIIIDGNGSAQNIRGDHVTLQASTPSLRDAELNRDTAISEYSAKVAEAAAKLLQLEILQQQLKSYQQMVSQAELQQSLAASIERLTALQQRAAQASVDSASAYVDILNTALNAATVVRNAAAIVAGAAQAIPFSGDAGADAAFAVVDLALSAATLALDSYERYTLAPRQDALDDLNNQLDVATAALTDAQTNLNMATTIRDTTQTSKDMADLAVFKANVARDAAQQVRKQAVSAYDLNKDIDSSADKPLGITANRLDVNQGSTLNTDLFLDSTGSIGLGDIEVISGKQIVASANQDLNLVGTVHSDKSISLNAGNSIQGAGGKLFTPDLLLKANNGIGNLTAVNTQVDRLAASAGNAGVNIVNRNSGALLSVTSEGAVNGVSGNGDISIDTDGSLRVEKLISDTNQTHTVTLTSGGAIVDGNGQERNVQGGTLVVNALNGVELDSEIVRLQAQITGVGDFAIREASELVVDSLSTADGDIDVDATGNITVGSLSAAGHRIDLASGGRIDDDNNNATQIVANELGLTAAGSIGGTGAHATRALDTHVGSVDATAHGEINIAEQDDLSVGVVETDTGNITLTSGGSLDIGRVATGTTSDTITLMAANAIRNALNDGAANLTAANLALTAGSGIGEGKALNVSADRLVASGGSGGVEVTDLDGDLTIGGVTANLGLPTPFGLNSTGGDIRVQADGGSLFVDEMVVTLGGGDIALGAEGSLQQNAAVLGAANVSLTADDDITQNAVIVTSNGDIALAAGGSISQNALNLTVSGDISLQATDGDVTIAAGATNTVTGAGNITVEAGEDVVQNAAMSTGSGNISVKAGSGDVTIASAATSTVTGAGDITIEAGSNVQQGANFSTGTGDISVTAHTGNIEMGSGVSSIVGGTGNIAYNAGSNAVIGDLGSITGNIGVLAGGDIQQNGNIVTTTGDISLAADGDIQQAGDTGTDEGSISVVAGNDLLQ